MNHQNSHNQNQERDCQFKINLNNKRTKEEEEPQEKAEIQKFQKKSKKKWINGTNK